VVFSKIGVQSVVCEHVNNKILIPHDESTVILRFKVVSFFFQGTALHLALTAKRRACCAVFARRADQTMILSRINLEMSPSRSTLL
jgi:hypothetical protein